MLGERPAGLDVLLAPPRSPGQVSLRALFDLTGDQQLTAADGFLWALLAAVGGVLVLLVGYGIAVAGGWLLRAAFRGVRWALEETGGRIAGLVAGAIVDRRLPVPRTR